jgi:hypothetical protein
MFRRIQAIVVLLATALGFAAATAGTATATAGTATAGSWRATTSVTTRTTKPPTTEGQAKHRPAKDHAARILVTFSAIYFATLLLLIFQP